MKTTQNTTTNDDLIELRRWIAFLGHCDPSANIQVKDLIVTLKRLLPKEEPTHIRWIGPYLTND